MICIDALEENKFVNKRMNYDVDFAPGDLSFLSLVKSELSFSMQMMEKL